MDEYREALNEIKQLKLIDIEKQSGIIDAVHTLNDALGELSYTKQYLNKLTNIFINKQLQNEHEKACITLKFYMTQLDVIDQCITLNEHFIRMNKLVE